MCYNVNRGTNNIDFNTYKFICTNVLKGETIMAIEPQLALETMIRMAYTRGSLFYVDPKDDEVRELLPPIPCSHVEHEPVQSFPMDDVKLLQRQITAFTMIYTTSRNMVSYLPPPTENIALVYDHNECRPKYVKKNEMGNQLFIFDTRGEKPQWQPWKM